jgi:hypothetical protein
VGRAVIACGALIVAAIIVPGPGSAAADVGVVVIEAREAPSGAAEVAGALAAAIEAGGEVAVRRPADEARAALAGGAVPAGELVGFTRVAELVEEGWRAYLEVQTEFAVSRLGEARRQAEAVLALDGGLEAYAEAALRLGAALDSAGRQGEADDVLRLAGVLDPGRTVTVQEFSPDVVAAAKRAREASRATRGVRISARGAAEAEIEVDGKKLGRGPVETVLEIGQHVVVVRGGDARARGETFSIAAGSEGLELVVDVDRDPRPGALAAGPEGTDAELTTWADAVATYADLDGLILVSSVWRSNRPALLAQWCDGAPLSCTAIVEIGHDEGGLAAAARAALDDLARARDGRRYAVLLASDPRVERGRRPIPGGRCRWCRPAIVAGASIAVIAAAAAVYLIATDEDENPIVVLDPGDFGR